MNKLLVKKMSSFGGLLAPQKEGDVGFDMVVSVDTILPPNQQTPFDVPCDVQIKLPPKTWGLIINRSSTTRKMGIIIIPGIIDEGYTGPLYACCINMTDKEIQVHRGTRLSQIIIMPSIVPKIQQVNTLPETKRGSTGFGSTDDINQYKAKKHNCGKCGKDLSQMPHQKICHSCVLEITKKTK